jgi:hypothetical protein
MLGVGEMESAGWIKGALLLSELNPFIVIHFFIKMYHNWFSKFLFQYIY